MRRTLKCLSTVLALSAVTVSPATEVFRDRELAGGFNLSAVSTASKPLELGVILRAESGARDEWRLAQWGTRFDAKATAVKTLPDGTRILRNAGKSVKILPGGLAGGGIVLGVNGSAEFGAQARQQGQFWPHLLIEQQIPKDFRIADAGTLNFNLDFKVEDCKNPAGLAVDPALHTAQVSAYWTLQNRNKDSADHGQMFWFGLPVFDARHEVPPGHQAVDIAEENGRFICTIDGGRFYKEPTGDGRWHTLACDLVPLVKEALAASQAQGHLTQTRFEDLYATSFNLGWEVPGPYDCEIALKNLSLVRGTH